jgi:hypothetical protein
MNDAETEQGLDPNSSIFQSIMQNPIVQRTLNNPKTFFSKLRMILQEKYFVFFLYLSYVTNSRKSNINNKLFK